MDVEKPESRGKVLPVQQANISPTPTPPFFAFLSWWRRFVFRILTPRELSVYIYVCSIASRDGLAYRSYAQIGQELGVSSLDVITKVMKKLTSYGFLIRNTQRIKGFQRRVYQRPAPEFTLIRLLDAKAIDYQLFPLEKSHDFDEDLDTTERAVQDGLRNLLGLPAFTIYMKARDHLRGLLATRFTQRTGMSYEDAWAVLQRADIRE